MAYQIIIAEDEKWASKTLSETVDAADGYEILLKTASGTELLEANLSGANCLFLDLSINDRNGTALVPQLKANYPSLKILVISSRVFDLELKKLLEEGINGYIVKDELDPPKVIFEAIKFIEKGGIYFSSDVAGKAMAILKKLGKRKEDGQISPHLWAIAYYVSKGLTDNRISEIMSLSARTIANHKTRLADRLNLEGRKDLVGELSKERYRLLMIDAVRDKELPEIED